jgi:GH24 family phage-related lysozyme (muramidase)
MRRFLARVLLAVGCVLFAHAAIAQEQEPELLPSRVIEFVGVPAFPEVATLSLSATQQTMSEKGIEVLKVFESFRARAYRDGGGGYSIGYGFQTWKGRRVTLRYPGRVTQVQADAELQRQLETYVGIVLDVSTDLPQEAFDAFVSIAYNLGRVNNTICYKVTHQLPITVRDFLSTAKVRNRTDWRLQGRRTREFLMMLGDYEAAMAPVESPHEVRATMAALAKRPVHLF